MTACKETSCKKHSVFKCDSTRDTKQNTQLEKLNIKNIKDWMKLLTENIFVTMKEIVECVTTLKHLLIKGEKRNY